MKRLDNYVKMIGGVATAEYTAVAVAYANLIDQIGVAFGRAAAALARAEAAATAADTAATEAATAAATAPATAATRATLIAQAAAADTAATDAETAAADAERAGGTVVAIIAGANAEADAAARAAASAAAARRPAAAAPSYYDSGPDEPTSFNVSVYRTKDGKDSFVGTRPAYPSTSVKTILDSLKQSGDPVIVSSGEQFVKSLNGKETYVTLGNLHLKYDSVKFFVL